MVAEHSALQRALTLLLATFLLTFCQKAVPQSLKTEPVRIPHTRIRQPPLSDELVSAGWIALFDGHSLLGWRRESTAHWRVEDGEICVDGRVPGMIRTASQFDDFELVVEFAGDDSCQAGVMLRTSPRPGPQDGFRVPLSDAGKQFPADESGKYRQLQVNVRSQDVEVKLDGRKIALGNEALRHVRRGYIGLLFESGALRIRQIRLRPLFLRQNADRSDLSQWTASVGQGFAVKTPHPHEIQLTGGPGYLESRETFQDFICQLQCWISRDGNSGVFYRCIPGQNTNGYEVQIDNRVLQEDAWRPANGGTGGIFGRQDARRVVAVDESWFAQTIVAEGPHVAVWVNGYQVLDWSDTRPPHENPRRGRRLERGSLMLQGHDRDTTVRFREIRVRELQKRR